MTTETLEPLSSAAVDDSVLVRLSSGEDLEIGQLDFDALQHLQWREERQFAAQIAASARGSAERKELFRQAYDTVTTIYGRLVNSGSQGPAMGYDPRYTRLVQELLARRNTKTPRVFEIGYGCGALLATLDGIDLAGIEVSPAMREQACRRLAARHHDRLLVGDFLTQDLSAEQGCDLVFWNDVLEHLVPDDVPDFLQRIYQMLAPGGFLVTITPNWHMRPTDVTAEFCPPRTTAVGFHLQEYRLSEVRLLLRAAGFVNVATPLMVTHQRIVLAGSGLAGTKVALEPLLEWLPYRAAKLICRGAGLCCTIAQRPE